MKLGSLLAVALMTSAAGAAEQQADEPVVFGQGKVVPPKLPIECNIAHRSQRMPQSREKETERRERCGQPVPPADPRK